MIIRFIRHLELLLETRVLLLSFGESSIFVSLVGDAEPGFVLSLLFVDVVTMELEDDKEAVDATNDGGGNVLGRTGYL